MKNYFEQSAKHIISVKLLSLELKNNFSHWYNTTDERDNFFKRL